MKKFIIKYANLMLIAFFLMIPIMTRAKVVWWLFTMKQAVLRHLKISGGHSEGR
jgi:hypothetical protein